VGQRKLEIKDQSDILKIHLQGMPGLSQAARDELLHRQPATVAEALKIHGIGRKTTKKFLTIGLLTDPDGVQIHARTAEEMGLNR
jgi:tRNA U34 5-carboxymethylaminomethyl modifying enzyme MnmG/GidA